jgi:hypothetical protein
VVPFCSRTTQHLIAMMMMCKIWCSVGARRCWHILPTLQISPHVIIDCFHVWKNIFGENNLNRKMISTLLLLPLESVWARTNTKLQLIIYHVDGKSVWTVLVITLSRGHVYKHAEICSILLLQ